MVRHMKDFAESSLSFKLSKNINKISYCLDSFDKKIWKDIYENEEQNAEDVKCQYNCKTKLID